MSCLITHLGSDGRQAGQAICPIPTLRPLGRFALRMNSNSFGVRTCVLADGQRIPLLVDHRTALPVEATTRFTLVKRWQVGSSSGTATNELRSVALLMSWARRLRIDVEARIESGAYFSSAELEALVDALRERQRGENGASENVAFVGLGRGARKIAAAELRCPVVGNEVWYQRIKYIQGYLRWRMDDAITRVSTEDDRFFRIRLRADEVVRKLESQLPSTVERHREGLGPELRSRFMQIIDPASPENPFQKPNRFRNYVLLRLIFETGCRLSEALVLYTTDYHPDARRPTLVIHRRPHNPLDSRVDLPLVKTRPRALPLASNMAELLETLITEDRKKVPGAKKSPFVFLARDGTPLARRSVEDLPKMIRRAFPKFERLTIHMLRHDWNDRFSYLAREKGWSDEKEAQHRNYLQGWTKTSKQGLNYTRRSTREEAISAALELQRRDWTGAARG
jgi:integrase